MTESGEATSGGWWRSPLSRLQAKLQQREDQVFLILALVIGALTGLAVVAFILLTERVGIRLYPVGSAPERRLMLPVVGSLVIGYLLYRYFPNARGSGVPQTKAALFAREGRITLRTVLGKFFCTSATLASGIFPLGPRGTFGPGWRRHCFRARATPGIAPRKSEGAFAGGRGSSNCSRV
jgi:chloride channel protein, CIC family